MKRNRAKSGPPLYATQNIDLKVGDQLRITHKGRNAVFIYVNGRGINFRSGYRTRAKKIVRG